MRRPEVSVIIPVYNRPRFVIEAIDSALAQAGVDLEVIVCDNASTDDTWERVQARAAGEPRLRCWRAAANMGPLENWRAGAGLARGRLAALLFSDDRWQPGFLASAVPVLAAPDVGFAFSTVVVERPEGPPFFLYAEFPAGRRPVAEFVGRHLGAESGRTVPSSPGCALFRTADLSAGLATPWPDPLGVGFSRLGAGPDLWIYLAAAARYPALVHLGEPLVVFRDHKESLTRSAGVALGYAAAKQRFVEEFGAMGVNREDWAVAQLRRLRRIDGGAAGADLLARAWPLLPPWTKVVHRVRSGASTLRRRLRGPG